MPTIQADSTWIANLPNVLPGLGFTKAYGNTWASAAGIEYSFEPTGGVSDEVRARSTAEGASWRAKRDADRKTTADAEIARNAAANAARASVPVAVNPQVTQPPVASRPVTPTTAAVKPATPQVAPLDKTLVAQEANQAKWPPGYAELRQQVGADFASAFYAVLARYITPGEYSVGFFSQLSNDLVQRLPNNILEQMDLDRLGKLSNDFLLARLPNIIPLFSQERQNTFPGHLINLTQQPAPAPTQPFSVQGSPTGIYNAQGQPVQPARSVGPMINPTPIINQAGGYRGDPQGYSGMDGPPVGYAGDKQGYSGMDGPPTTSFFPPSNSEYNKIEKEFSARRRDLGHGRVNDYLPNLDYTSAAGRAELTRLGWLATEGLTGDDSPTTNWIAPQYVENYKFNQANEQAWQEERKRLSYAKFLN